MVFYEDVQEVVYDAAKMYLNYGERFVTDTLEQFVTNVTRRVMDLINVEMTSLPIGEAYGTETPDPESPPEDRFSEGYDAGLEDAQEWVRTTTQEWYDLKIISAEQFLPIKDLLHEFDLRFLYDPRERSAE